MKTVAKIGGAVVLLVLLVVGGFYLSTYHPADVQNEPVQSPASAPLLTSGQTIKVLSWNVQFMAGKNYVFFFDKWDNSGPDLRPKTSDISVTFGEVARIVREENPDILLIQELDVGASRTDGQDQLARLLNLLPPEYVSSTSAWYWKAAFVPHPQIMGSVGMKLAVISKYRMNEAVRYQLPLMPNNPVVTELQFKRAVLEARFPVTGGGSFSAMSIHQDAFAQGSDTMQRQVELVSNLLKKKEAEGQTWMLGGDFNLLPPVRAIYDRLPDSEKPYFQPESEIGKLFDQFPVYPTLAQVSGPEAPTFFTHAPNGGEGLDRTIDYEFVSPRVTVKDFHVRQSDTGWISDHAPLVINLVVP